MKIDVVIPYFDGPDRLTSILLALNVQIDARTGALLDEISIVIADDASALPPDPTTSRHPIEVVRLADDGYHAAAARNRGAATGVSPIVVFLDGDTVPSSTYISRLVGPIVKGSAALTTGHRRHADFDGLSAENVTSLATDQMSNLDQARLLPEPMWLADGLRWTDRLRSGTPDVFQYVISAVLAVERTMFDSVGGFDESFDSYGGEDWEFAYRCWNAGWHFEHVADAVAFHDGPDVEGRTPNHLAKTIENIRVAEMVPSSPTRLASVRYTVPDIDVEMVLLADDSRTNAIALYSILDSERRDFRVRLHGDRDQATMLMRLVGDERVVPASFVPHPSARCHVSISRPVELSMQSLGLLCDDICRADGPNRRVLIGGSTIEAWSVRTVTAARRRGVSGVPFENVPADDLGICSTCDDDLAAWSRRRSLFHIS